MTTVNKGGDGSALLLGEEGRKTSPKNTFDDRVRGVAAQLADDTSTRGAPPERLSSGGACLLMMGMISFVALIVLKCL